VGMHTLSLSLHPSFTTFWLIATLLVLPLPLLLPPSLPPAVTLFLLCLCPNYHVFLPVPPPQFHCSRDKDPPPPPTPPPPPPPPPPLRGLMGSKVQCVQPTCGHHVQRALDPRGCGHGLNPEHREHADRQHPRASRRRSNRHAGTPPRSQLASALRDHQQLAPWSSPRFERMQRLAAGLRVDSDGAGAHPIG